MNNGMTLTPAQSAFMGWARKEINPAVLNRAIAATNAKMGSSSMSGFGDTATSTAAPSSWWNSFTNTLSSLAQSGASIVTSLTSAKASQQLTNLNLTRAQQGLPPLSASQAGVQPTATVQVGTSPTLNMVMIGAVAILGIWLLSRR